MSDLTTLVRTTIKRYGNEAAAHFGITQGRLDGYVKRGKYPLALIEKILHEQMERPPESGPVAELPPPPPPEPQPPPPPRQKRESESQTTSRRVEDIIKYIQSTVDVYIKQFAHRLDVLERQVAALQIAQLRVAGAPSLARPDQNVPVEQTFTTNPVTGLRNALDSGIAPTREQVEAQANMTIIEGVPVPGGELARPAEFIPNQPSFGFGWNVPRPRK